MRVAQVQRHASRAPGPPIVNAGPAIRCRRLASTAVGCGAARSRGGHRSVRQWLDSWKPELGHHGEDHQRRHAEGDADPEDRAS